LTTSSTKLTSARKRSLGKGDLADAETVNFDQPVPEETGGQGRADEPTLAKRDQNSYSGESGSEGSNRQGWEGQYF